MDINCLRRPSSYFSALISASLPGPGNLKTYLSVSQIRLFSGCHNLRDLGKILPCSRAWLSIRCPDIPHCTGTQTLRTSSNPLKYLLCLLLCSHPYQVTPFFVQHYLPKHEFWLSLTKGPEIKKINIPWGTFCQIENE